jgi:sulfide:quinone oxidoreductase
MPFKVVVAGGGVAGLEAVLALSALAGDRVALELAAPEPVFSYRPLAVAEPFDGPGVASFDLAAITDDCDATLRIARLVSVDPAGRTAAFDDGQTTEYDALLVACGSVYEPAVPGADTFRGTPDVPRFRELLAEIEAGSVRSLAFVVPHGVVWPLPLYELALMTAAWPGRGALSLHLVTAEEEPLGVLGPAPSRAVSRALQEHDIAVRAAAFAVAVSDGRLTLAPTGAIEASRFVALARQRGIPIPGVPSTPAGFVPVDEHACVEGLPHVYAAGDITTYPVKQGGVAAQQADAAAEYIAAEAGAAVLPRPFRPVLRTVLLTGDGPRYLSSRMRNGRPLSSVASRWPSWSPADKIAAPFLAPYLGSILSAASE